MMPTFPNFIGGSYASRSSLQDNEQTVNFYIEPMEGPGGKSKYALYPTPGVETFGTATLAAGRAAFAMSGRAFCVIGSAFYELAFDGTLTQKGTVAIDNNPATICTNGDGGGQLFVTSGNNGYIFDLTTEAFTLERTGATRMGAHLDGYFIALDADTSTIFLSDLLDGTTWDPTQFAQRSIQPDPWVSLAVFGRFLWLLGEQTSEVWEDTGAFPFPFAPHPSGLVDYGCVAPFSPEVVAGALMWLARTANGQGAVVRASGFVPDEVSTYALQLAFANASTLQDGIGDTYEDLGHTFYILTFPSADVTVCYDASTNGLPPSMRWTNRGTWIASENRYAAWRPLFHCFAFGKHLMLDRSGSAIYHLSAEFASDVEGAPIRRLRRPPGLWDEDKRLVITLFAVHCDVGIGLTSGQGETPMMAARFSGNGGRTFGNERLRSAGRIGAWETRVRWLMCGSGRQWVPEIVMSDPVPWKITGASFEKRAA